MSVHIYTEIDVYDFPTAKTFKVDGDTGILSVSDANRVMIAVFASGQWLHGEYVDEESNA